MKEGHKIVLAILITYVVMSFVPQIGLMNFLGKKPKG